MSYVFVTLSRLDRILFWLTSENAATMVHFKRKMSEIG